MDPREDWTQFVEWDAPVLLLRLCAVSQALSQLHVEYGTVRAQEKHAKVQGFARAMGEPVTSRQHAADANAVTITETVFSLEGQIKELQEEKGLLILLLEHK